MKKTLAMMLCILTPLVVIASDNSYKVTYDGGSVPDIKAGTGLNLYIESNQLRLTRDKLNVIAIPVSSVTEISYGQDVHRRVGAAIGIGVVTLGVGGVDGPYQIEEAFRRIDVGQWRPKGWFRDAVR